MRTGGTNFWNSGAVPLVDPQSLSEIIAAASDIAIVLDQNTIIQSVAVSPAADGFGNLSHWEGRPLIEFLGTDSVAKFQKAFEQFSDGQDLSKPIELNHEDNAAWQYPVRYSMHRFGENTALLLGRDLRPIAETQQQLVQAQIALEQGYEARREFDSRYRIMLTKTREAILFINLRDGRISDCSDAAAMLLGVKRDAATGTGLSQLLSDRSSAELMESLLNASLAKGGGSIDVRAERSDQRITMEPSVFRAGGQRILHCRLTKVGETPMVADAEAPRAMALYRAATDAIIFTDAEGAILSGNDAFLDLIGAAHNGDIRGKNLGDFLVRGQIDMGVLADNAQRAGHMRTYATKLTNVLGARLSVEISATHLKDPTTPLLAFIIRDISRVEGVRGSANSRTPEEGNRNVMELVGSASLKEIVAETTDVVEKMCIETAVNLTKNNRVAAAEMLGLSRQSLYVKLRKYGLLSKDA